jgi:hypothetical protein
VIDHGPWYEFAGWPGIKCWKKFLGRRMTAEDYAEIFRASLEETAVRRQLTGFYSQKTKKRFAAIVQFDGNRFKLVFDKSKQKSWERNSYRI